jgi:hypothetical protein
MSRLDSISRLYRNTGPLSLFKILYFKILQRLRRKYFLVAPPIKINITKVRKIFPAELFEKNIFKESYSEKLKNIVQLADEILNGKCHFLGVDFIFEKRPNWHFDPADNKSWDVKIYDERKIIYPGSPKDPKIVWELNRHQYLFTLAKAYFLTSDEKYVDIVLSHIKSWIEDNPFGKGINWASPLEISIRLISWTFTLDLIGDSINFKNYKETIFNSIYAQAVYLSRTLSIDRVIRTNHLLGELTGLFFVSTVFKFKESEKWRNKALKLFFREIPEQIFQEGVSKEQSTSYHRFVIDFTLLIINYCKRFNISYRAYLDGILEKMIEYLLFVSMPDGKTPAIGDSDDGRGFRFSESDDFWDMRGSISSGAVIFDNGSMKNISKRFYEESFWLLGTEGLKKYLSINSFEPKTVQKLFHDSGHYVIRSSWKDDADYLFIRAGIFGMGGDGFSSHSHDDLLSPIICIKGKQLLVDSGTYAYNIDCNIRNKFKSSKAHNNITWNNKISISKPNFGWDITYNTKLVNSRLDYKSIFLEFSIDKVPEYRRIIRYDVEKRAFIIEDFFEKDFEDLEWRFHINAGLNVNKVTNGYIEILEQNTLIAKMNYDVNGSLNIDEDTISLYYGRKVFCSIVSSKKSVKKGESVIFKLY